MKEEEILKFWQENKIFEKSLAKSSPQGEFVFFEGPPTANGRPGIHHLEARAFKDAIPRYKTMRGFHVRRKGGWDTHGLPVELQVEKELGLKSKKEVETYGIAAFNKKCKESVWTYVHEWEEFTNRIGYWVDLENPYITYKSEYIEALWQIVKTIDEKGLLYKDYKVVPWCPRCETALSSHELAQGYEEVKDLALTIKFKVKNEPNTFLLAWTTTAWTLPGNVALAVGEKIDYVQIKLGTDSLILAAARLAIIKGPYQVERKLTGDDLVGLEYEPLYPFLQDKNNGLAFKVYAADFVTTTEGTGIVHTAVMYGPDDFELGTKVGLPKYHLVKEDGTFKSEAGFLAGQFVRDEAVAVAIIKDLTSRNLLLAKERYEHSYPFCWRCQTPLIYYARDSWYIKMSALREKLIKENEAIHWEPPNIKEGRFGEWLREVKDWAISRERYWGTPLPIWLCAHCQEKKVIGSVAKLALTSTVNNHYWVMRHGEAESNVRQIVSGAAPGQYHLTARGKEEAMAAAKELAAAKIDLIIASPVLRTRETAELVAAQLGLAADRIIFDDRLREINFGSLENASLTRYRAGPAADGETPSAVKIRARAFLAELDAAKKGKNILLVTHEAVAGFLGDYSLQTGEVKTLNLELDLHRPAIDEVKFKCACGGEMKRVKEVMDVWFDSGAMPFAQGGEFLYPADFISEAIDQTRGWFYTLHAIGILMGQGRAYKNVICLGHILDANGKKMSKSLGNVVDPRVMINKYGADALRFWMYSINQPGESKNFDEKTVAEVVKKVLNPLTNVLAFYQMYQDQGVKAATDSTQILDRWIIARLNQLLETTTTNLDNYILFEPARAIREFINDLSTWYLRRSRERFKFNDEADKKAALATTRHILKELAKIIAPFMPFIAEEIYLAVKEDNDQESVHLENWPQGGAVDSILLAKMRATREIVSAALELRAAAGIKIRQPLASLAVKTVLPEEYLALIKDELNVAEIKVGETFQLDTNLTPELKEKGELRDLIREIQDWRKAQNLKAGELASMKMPADKKDLIAKHQSEIRQKCLIEFT